VAQALDIGRAAAASPLSGLRSGFRAHGRVEWIGVRPLRRDPLVACETLAATPDDGLSGDHGRGGRRAVTLIQYEHLPAIASLAGRATVDPAMLRRNLCVSGINLLALRDARFRVGEMLLEGTGLCAPCSRMNEAAILGPGGYNAMRGHGGITARVIEGGRFSLGDPVAFVALVDAGAGAAQRSLDLS